MTQIPRRNISELFFLYEVEPNIIDIFVEGPFDKAIIQFFLNEISIHNVSVYEIETIEIDDEELISLGRKANNRERAMLLSEKFDAAGINSNQLICIIDKDFCHFLGECVNTPQLLYTDFSCMEMYFFDDKIIKKFLTTFCYKNDWPCDQLLESISKYIERIYLFRLINEALNWQMAMFDRVICISIKDWKIIFDEDEFIKRLLNKNQRNNEFDEFNSNILLHEKNLLEDSRYQMHGHDFINIFSFFLKKKGVSKEIANITAVSRALILTLSTSFLLQYDLFDLLLKRVMVPTE